VVAVQLNGSNMTVTTSEPAADSSAALAKMAGTSVSVLDRYPASAPVTSTPAPTVPVVTDPVVNPPVSGKAYAPLCCNVGMGAGGTSVLPGVNGTHYRVASNQDIDTATGVGFKILRIGCVSERLFKTGLKAELYTNTGCAMDALLAAGAYTGTKGAKVMWDLFHNYGGQTETGNYDGSKKWGTATLPVSLFVKQWAAAARKIMADPKACAATYAFDLMNEWVDVPDQVIFDCYQGVMTEIGAECASKGIKLSLNGRNYSSTSDFPNNTLFANLKHPSGNQWIEFSPHLYLDSGSDGYYNDADKAIDAAAAAVVGVNRLKGAFEFAKKLGVSMNIGENIVTGDQDRLLVGEEALLRFCIENSIPVFIFGISQDFGDNHHNLMLDINKPMLALVKKLIAEYGI
jgi:hypothetical protein